MPVEILTVGLDDAAIEKIAQRVAQLVGGSQPGYQPVTSAPAVQATQSAQTPQQESDPWLDSQPPQQPVSQPQQAQQSGPQCQHGAMRYVPAGFSQGSGKAYRAFWACPTPRGAQDKCKSVPVQQQQ